MTRLLLALAVLGALVALFLEVFPADWQVPIAIGWSGGLMAEALLSAKRRQTMQDEASKQALMMVMVFGFLGRLTFLFLGAIVGALADLYPEGPFLGAALGAIFLGESLSLPGLMRSQAAKAGRNGSSADSTNPS